MGERAGVRSCEVSRDDPDAGSAEEFAECTRDICMVILRHMHTHIAQHLEATQQR
eukprot:COSAG06_NODE_3067_length_5897_cov_5.614005_3_plen_55_part_00